MLNKIFKYIPIYIVLDGIRWLIIALQIPFSFFRALFIKPEIKKLKNYTKDHEFIYVYASIETEISESSKNILKTIKALGGYIILITNNKSYTFNEQAKALTDVFIDCKNTGWDFNQYKQATKYIYKHLTDYSFIKVFYANDSVFYLPTFLRENMLKMLSPDYEYIGIFDNSGRKHYHIGSWGFSISKELFMNKSVVKFWNRFFEIKNKFYAIERGEIGLSKVLLSLYPTIYVIYNANFINGLGRLNLQHMKYLGNSILEDFFEERSFMYANKESSQDALKDFVAHNSANYPLAQTLFPLLTKFYDMPFVKKDIFWIEAQPLSSLSLVFSILDEKLTLNYSNFIKAYFLKRGRISTARTHARLLTLIGVR
jgi:hypothetical protein